MGLEQLIDWSKVKLPTSSYVLQAQSHASEVADRTFDDLIHVNTRILRAKLEAIATTARERLNIRRKNLERITDDKYKLSQIVQKITVSANYGLREHREKGALYQKMFELARERRDQDTECWRDIVLVLRDFLTFWDEYERASARGAFLENV